MRDDLSHHKLGMVQSNQYGKFANQSLASLRTESDVLVRLFVAFLFKQAISIFSRDFTIQASLLYTLGIAIVTLGECRFKNDLAFLGPVDPPLRFDLDHRNGLAGLAQEA